MCDAGVWILGTERLTCVQPDSDPAPAVGPVGALPQSERAPDMGPTRSELHPGAADVAAGPRGDLQQGRILSLPPGPSESRHGPEHIKPETQQGREEDVNPSWGARGRRDVLLTTGNIFLAAS